MARRKRSSPPSGWRTPGIAQRIACMQGIKKRGCGIHTQEIQRTLFFGRYLNKTGWLVRPADESVEVLIEKNHNILYILQPLYTPVPRATSARCMHSVKAAHPKPTGTVIPRVRYDTRMRIPNKQLCVSATNREVTEDLT
ncbi:hypothetical protein PoMZ_00320 [Pyricularia oryzae]|uniref:Uncharacterized protein n=1 Tax=Pyricularia oryzae TaxID=318829 RepID=A0A4P7MZV0_PYROR|nr:hypothetical protein PoMZ_00320 [Pyricularia oryzae]